MAQASHSRRFSDGQVGAAPQTMPSQYPQAYAHPPPHHIPPPPPPRIPESNHISAFNNVLMSVAHAIERTEGRMFEQMKELDVIHRDSHALLQNDIQEVLKTITSSRNQSQVEMRQLAKFLESSHALQVKAMQNVYDHVHLLEDAVGTLSPATASSPSGQPTKKSLTQRMDSMECLLYELLEKSNDPEAPSTSPAVFSQPIAYLHNSRIGCIGAQCG